MAGSVVGIASTTDPGDTFTYAVTVDPSGFFEMVANQLQVKDGAALDYETATSHNITIQTTDAGALVFSDTYTINVNDVNEAPTALALSANDVDDGQSNTTAASGTERIDLTRDSVTFLSDSTSDNFVNCKLSGLLLAPDLYAAGLLYNGGAPIDLATVGGSPYALAGSNMTADERGGNISEGWNDDFNLGDAAVTTTSVGLFTDV